MKAASNHLPKKPFTAHIFINLEWCTFLMESKKTVIQVRKRNGTIALFNKQKVMLAVSKAMDAVDDLDLAQAEIIGNEVVERANEKLGGTIPSVEQVQDIVEEILMKSGHVKVAKAYILYRHQRYELREAKKALLHGVMDDEIEFSINALQILENRYLLRNENGVLVETPSQMFKRVAKHIANADKKYNGNPKESEKSFYSVLSKKLFLPTSPTLMNAGTPLGQLVSPFAVPVDDDVSSIFDAVKYAALVHQSGGGTGFSFSRLRPRRDKVGGALGISSGPLSFMRIFEISVDIIKQAGKRQGANMGILRVDHPDIMEFINLKADGVSMPNFNLSVGLTDAFMRALRGGTNYSIINPRNKGAIATIPARVVFDNIVAMAWRKGEPGIVFLDRINKKHSCQHLGRIETTSPCGEMPLLPFESAAEGSINLVKMVDDDNIFNWERLKQVLNTAVHFLDNVITINKYPLKEIREASLNTRKMGLGIMGFADVLYKMGIKYDSDEGVIWAKKIMSFVQKTAHDASEKLAISRGDFPAWKGSKFELEKRRMRNATVTAILPTGTMSMIADVSPGLEPNFALCFIRKALDGREFVYTNSYFKNALIKEKIYSETMLRNIAKRGTMQGMTEIPKKIRDIFVTAQDIPARWHIKMQAAFQEFTDGAISKTINFSSSATVKDVEEGLLAAWDLGCKGVTVYRDGSIDAQIINLQKQAIALKKAKNRK